MNETKLRSAIEAHLFTMGIPAGVKKISHLPGPSEQTDRDDHAKV